MRGIFFFQSFIWACVRRAWFVRITMEYLREKGERCGEEEGGRILYPSSWTCLSFFGTMGRHHSNLGGAPFFGKVPWMRQPSRSKAATLADGFGSPLMACRQERVGPRAGESQRKADAFKFSTELDLWKSGNTATLVSAILLRELRTYASVLCVMGRGLGNRGRVSEWSLAISGRQRISALL